MDPEEGVRNIVQKAHSKNEEIRKTRRLAVQSSRRTGLPNSRECGGGAGEGEVEELVVGCKAGKLSTEELGRLGELLAADTGPALTLSNKAGAVAGLVGLMTGSDPARQLGAAQCLVNLAGRDECKPALLARQAGAYLVTLTTSPSPRLAELACLALANLARAGGGAVSVLLGLDCLPALTGLATSCTSTTQEAALQALYQLVTSDAVSDHQLGAVAGTAVSLLASTAPRPPSHLLWLLYSLSVRRGLHPHLARADTLHKALQAATYEIFQKCDSRPLVGQLTPLVRLLANLAAGPDSVAVCLSLLRHPDLPAILTALLSTNYTHLCRETLWLLANIINNENVTVQEEFVQQDLMDRLEGPAAQAVSRVDPFALAS